MGVSHVGNVERTVAQLSTLLGEKDAGVFQISGGEPEDQSRVLRLLGKRLAKSERVPIMVSPPRKALDAAQVAMIQVAGQLRDAQCINGELEEFIAGENLGWRKQRRMVSRWLNEHAEDVVILCDEPYRWSPGDESLRHFSEKSDSIVHLLLDELQCQRVVADVNIGDGEISGQIDVDSNPNYQDWLESGQKSWGLLTGDAEALWETFECELHQLSPLKMRLLVALTHLHSVEWIKRKFELFAKGSRNQLTNELFAAVSTEKEFFKTWSKFSLVREELEAQLVDEIVDVGLDDSLRDILTACILSREGDHFVLEEALRLEPRRRSWLSSQEQRETHRFLASYYAGRMDELSDEPKVARALRCEMEGFHHGYHGGLDDVEGRFRSFFVEQLNLLGGYLSREEKRYKEATTVFERAVSRDDENDYSHHYLAYNIDIRGEQPERVEKHYRRAIELVDDHAWWWSRWICFLITRGRLREAHIQWGQALDALSLPDPNASNANYENLHKWVARLLLHSGKLNFAEEVLRGVPNAKKEVLRGFRAMENLLVRLRDAEERKTVFPASTPLDERWNGPVLHPESHGGKGLVRWLPARVSDTDELAIYLVVAEEREADQQPVFSRLTVERELFDDWAQDMSADAVKTGRFLELAVYGDPDDAPVIRVHPERPYKDRDLPPLIPEPTRYLQEDDATQ